MMAPLTRLWSSPCSWGKLLFPSILCTDRGCSLLRVSASLQKIIFCAAGPLSSTVVLPKRRSLETGPYLFTRCCTHISPVLVRMARSSCRLWPMKGMPREPGGSFLLLLTFPNPSLTRRTTTGMKRSSSRCHGSITSLMICMAWKVALWENLASHLYNHHAWTFQSRTWKRSKRHLLPFCSLEDGCLFLKMSTREWRRMVDGGKSKQKKKW